MSIKYKMRAECQADVSRFMAKVFVHSMSATTEEINGIIIPDMEIEFTSPLSMAEIRKKMSRIVDGHVMRETLALHDEYTGERHNERA